MSQKHSTIPIVQAHADGTSPSALRDISKIIAINALALRLLRRQRHFAWWARRSSQERIATLAIMVGGTVVTIGSLAWAAALSYIAHQKVRMVKLEGIADERVAEQEAAMEVAADARDAVKAVLTS